MVIEKEANPHFKVFLFDWNQKFQFLVGRCGNSKSYHAILKLIMKLVEVKRTALVVRKAYNTHRNSTYSLLEEIINEILLENRIHSVTCPMQIRFSNSSKIIFKRMNKTPELKSI